ncbi:MAG: nucleotidyl transferase AbiEii/AbiGii toxin family protein [Bacteroidaceae bacterium]|nr:nucleotidyl transferase AbiEii/AbiGii toxin family protein [Bacteroidaceae bacterium]
MTALAPHTTLIFEKATKLECIKPYLLVGGTALSLQLGTRQSEDLDFMRWRTSKDEKMEVEWSKIRDELSTIGEVQSMNLMDIDHVEYVVSGVKFSFYACNRYSPVTSPVEHINNLKLADVSAIGAMKMEVMLRRSNFRDYYDIYSIIQNGYDINDIISKAGKYSNHQLKTKNILAMLTNGSRFQRDAIFEQMQPIYDVTAKDIENHIKQILQK